MRRGVSQGIHGREERRNGPHVGASRRAGVSRALFPPRTLQTNTIPSLPPVLPAPPYFVANPVATSSKSVTLSALGGVCVNPQMVNACMLD